MSYEIVCFDPSVPLNNKKICCKNSRDKSVVVRELRVCGAGSFRILTQRVRKR